MIVHFHCHTSQESEKLVIPFNCKEDFFSLFCNRFSINLKVVSFHLYSKFLCFSFVNFSGKHNIVIEGYNTIWDHEMLRQRIFAVYGNGIIFSLFHVFHVLFGPIFLFLYHLFCFSLLFPILASLLPFNFDHLLYLTLMLKLAQLLHDNLLYPFII